jgi:hypothetical protein
MLLADGDAEVVRDVGFQSWYAAQLAAAEPDAATGPMAIADTSEASTTNTAATALGSDDAPR